jgi:hypothetical protein
MGRTGQTVGVVVPPPLLIAAVACLVVAQVVGLVGLKMRLNLTATLAVMVLLGAAVTLGVLGGLQFLPTR